jgi:hypothetical protein
MDFSWDARKATSNRRKHGVSFDEASTVFNDPLAVTGADPDHSLGETRWITFGISKSDRILAVAHSDDGEIIRIISARVATRAERRFHEED